MSDDFDWHGRVDIVVPTQQAVAAYISENGDVVIRQERNALEDRDDLIVVSPVNLLALIDRLEALAEEFRMAPHGP